LRQLREKVRRQVAQVNGMPFSGYSGAPAVRIRGPATVAALDTGPQRERVVEHRAVSTTVVNP
jgi:hypothetical protein